MFSTSLFYFIFHILFYILIIYGSHELWNYLKDTYSTRKTKDLVGSQIQKYKKIVDEIQQNKTNTDTGSQVFDSEEDKQSMNDDLANFMKTL